MFAPEAPGGIGRGVLNVWVTLAMYLYYNSVSPSVCMYGSMYVCMYVPELLRDRWTDFVHIWGDDRYNTGG